MLMMDKLAAPKFKSKMDFTIRNLLGRTIKGSFLGTNQDILGQSVMMVYHQTVTEAKRHAQFA